MSDSNKEVSLDPKKIAQKLLPKTPQPKIRSLRDKLNKLSVSKGYEKSKEEIIKKISSSKYLYLLEGVNILFIRVEEAIDEKDLFEEQKLFKNLCKDYKLSISDDGNLYSQMSGDMNRTRISKGTLVTN